MQLGIDSFVETTPDPSTGELIAPADRVRDLLEEIELADQVGLDVFGIGEHHRQEFVASALLSFWLRRRREPSEFAWPAPSPSSAPTIPYASFRISPHSI
jgi:alkanesulfonate monooxygenase SsuD/methylene tetrahydromethanopterin reductase-like flavin-dependent oxidoreductase (luciferase family)